MSGVDITINGVGTVFRNLQAAATKFDTGAVTAAHAIAALLEGYAKSHHLYKDRTGNLTSSTRGWVAEITAEMITIFLGAGMEYAVFVEFAHGENYKWLRKAVDENRERIKAILAHYCGVG